VSDYVVVKLFLRTKMAPRPVETTKKKIVEDKGLRAHDVLLGRGSGPSQYKGNVRFRCVVWETFQDYLQGEQARHYRGGGKQDSLLPASVNAATKARLCRLVREKVTRLQGRFLQKVTLCSAESTDADSCLICVHHNQDEHGKGPQVTTYYKIADEKLVLNKIKQTLRFLLDQKFGRKERSDVVRVTEASFVGVERSGGPMLASAAMPAGTLSQGHTGPHVPQVLPNDTIARLLSTCHQPLPPPPVVIPHVRYDAITPGMLPPAQSYLQQRQQQQRQQQEALGILLRSGGEADMNPNTSNAEYASLEQQILAVSMASACCGFSGYGGITPGISLNTSPQALPTFISTFFINQRNHRHQLFNIQRATES
jgi:hypothetical protein